MSTSHESGSKILQVSAIKNGTVIDHIPAEKLFNVISILKLKGIDSLMTFGTNFESKHLGKKGIIKVEGKYFEDSEIDKIALVAPQAKLNIIKEYKVIEKRVVEIPQQVFGIVKCFNPNCITNHEDIPTRFYLYNRANVSLKCEYCEKITKKEHMEIIR